jgi:hypothetical protein
MTSKFVLSTGHRITELLSDVVAARRREDEAAGVAASAGWEAFMAALNKIFEDAGAVIAIPDHGGDGGKVVALWGEGRPLARAA